MCVFEGKLLLVGYAATVSSSDPPPPPQARSVLAQLQGHQGPVTAAEFCARQPHVVISVSEDRCFRVRGSLHTGRELRQLGRGALVRGLTFLVAATPVISFLPCPVKWLPS